MELNREQITKALECCGTKGSPNCKECPMEEGRGCAVRLYHEALAYINKRETDFNELYELAESYRKELGEVKADTVRKMHSMLCEGRVSNDTVVIVANQIAKEMLEGNK